jgi:hypothetical protein
MELNQSIGFSNIGNPPIPAFQHMVAIYFNEIISKLVVPNKNI